MNALVWRGRGQMAVEPVDVPTPGPGEVRVNVHAVGICGSELSGYLGENALRKPPLVMGHEFAGTVDAVGDRATRHPVGARVVVNPLVSCGTCLRCTAGNANLCAERQLIGAHRPGAFAEYVTVPEANCHVVADGLDLIQASLAEPVACSVRVVRLAGDVVGRRVRVIGAGPIGLFVAAVAVASGAADVTIHDPNRTRAALAERWGITAPEGPPALGDVTVDAVGRRETRALALTSLDRGGTAVFVGLHETATEFDGNDLVRDEKTVRGSFAYAPRDFADALGHLERGTIPVHGDDWLSVRALDEGQRSFEELLGATPSVAKIVLAPGDERRDVEGASHRA